MQVANLWPSELNIHEHTERGDNDSIKMPNGKTVVIDGKKCSDL
jgi:complex III assembly factor LYRM7